MSDNYVAVVARKCTTISFLKYLCGKLNNSEAVAQLNNIQ